jgi:hypothetical protein
MKNIYFLFMILIITGLSFAQKPNEVRASMGIDFVSVPSLKNYLEALLSEQLSNFASAVDFSGSYGRMISPNDQIEIEVSYLLNSFNSTLQDGRYNLTYSIIMPSAIYYYVISGEGYNFKFGGGAGPRFLSITEKFSIATDNYSSLGYGFILCAAGNTAIAENVFAHIGIDARYDSIKEPQPSQNPIVIGNVSFNSLSFGIRLGISYQF